VLMRADHPLWLCAFRPFFSLTVLSAFSLMLGWLLFLGLGWSLPAVAGGPFVWHVHELLLGFALAAVAGFTLTAVPEFTRTPAFDAGVVRWLVVLWLAGRVGFWASGAAGVAALALAAAAHLLFVGLLGAAVAPRLWGDPERKHLGFLWALVGLGVCTAGFYGAALVQAGDPMRWLRVLLGVLQMLIVVAVSRISMRIVNTALDEQAARMPVERLPLAAYLARPPRRNMALLCIGLFTLAQWAEPRWPLLAPVSGWLALAASASMLALMGDWHVGRALLRRWPLMLYAVYVFMAAGYALIGVAILSERVALGAGTHLLTVGAIGLAIYLVMVIAGYAHSGLSKEGRPWVLVGVTCLVLTVIVRTMAYLAGEVGWMHGAALLWCVAFGLMAWQMLPVWWSPRTDGKSGCED
jgi:uncharacterized protein involved in response to NO